MINEKELLKAVSEIKPYDSYDEYAGEDLIDEVFLIELSEVINCIKQQKKAGEWIPVSERLPEESLNSVIGWDPNYKRCCFVQYYNGEWSYPKYQYVLPEITAWMPMPEPYEEKNND